MIAPGVPALVNVRGPSALGGGVRRFAYLAVMLAWTNFKLRFFGSVLGYLWQLLRPLALFAVLLFVFTRVAKVGDAVAFYPVVLIANIVLFTWFADGSSAVTSLVDHENIVRKVHFPRLAIPVAVVLTASLNLLLNGLVVLVFALALGVRPRWTWLELPLLVGALGLLTLGVAMLLSALYVRFRDLKPIWDVALQVLFYGSPVLYALETVDLPLWVRELMMINPLAAILQEVRHAVIDPAAPTAAALAGGGWRLLVPAGIILGVFAVGYAVFDRQAPHIAEQL